MGGKGGEGVRAWSDGLAGEDVEVDQGDLVGLEEGRDGGFACRSLRLGGREGGRDRGRTGGDATCKADD